MKKIIQRLHLMQNVRSISLIIMSIIMASCVSKAEKKEHKDEIIKQEYSRKGGEIVKETQTALLKNVSQAMQKGGPGYAVEFCNIRALELKDSLSRLNNCEIRRLAIKYRNPKDTAQNEREEDLLKQYQLAFEQGDSLTAKVYILDNSIEYYQPIFLDKGACLVCHGTPGEQISEETLARINERYPNDLATGFELNDFRGVWKVTFQN